MLSNPLRVLVANGVNLDLLGQRQPQHYGSLSLQDLQDQLVVQAPRIAELVGCRPVELECFQSNCEATFLNKLSGNWDGCLLNPGAWTHTSLALADRLAALPLPFIEIHLSATYKREAIRRTSLCAPHTLGIIAGLGSGGYTAGLLALLQHLHQTHHASTRDELP